MACLNCDATNERDYPVCKTCETSCHFQHRNDCQCAPCQVERAQINADELRRLEAVAFDEELRLQYGRPVAAAA